MALPNQHLLPPPRSAIRFLPLDGQHGDRGPAASVLGIGVSISGLVL